MRVRWRISQRRSGQVRQQFLRWYRADEKICRSGNVDTDLRGWTGSRLRVRTANNHERGRVLLAKAYRKSAGWRTPGRGLPDGVLSDLETQPELERRGCRTSLLTPLFQGTIQHTRSRGED